jgi:hypothetical protein
MSKENEIWNPGTGVTGRKGVSRPEGCGRADGSCRELPSFVERLVGKRRARRLPSEGRLLLRWD